MYSPEHLVTCVSAARTSTTHVTLILPLVYHERCVVMRVGECGHALFDTLQEHMHVLYRTCPRIPSHVTGKAALRKWVKKHVRWAPAHITGLTDTHVEVLLEGGTGRHEVLSVQDVSNRLVIRSK